MKNNYNNQAQKSVIILVDEQFNKYVSGDFSAGYLIIHIDNFNIKFYI
jgi:hypothetical protein